MTAAVEGASKTTPQPGGASAAPFVRLRRAMNLAIISILLATSAMLVLGLKIQLDSAGEDLRRAIDTVAQSLDRRFDFAGDMVDGMAEQATFWLADHPVAAITETPLVAALFASERDGRMSFDTLPAPFQASQIGNLIVRNRRPDPGLRREVEMALSLMPLMRTALSAVDNSIWAYYLSVQGVGYFMPWAPSATFERLGDIRPHRVMTDISPEKNPRRERFFTDVYLDRTGRGAVVTVAKPIDDGGKAIGLAAIDISLTEMGEDLDHHAMRVGDMMVVSDQGNLLYHPTLSGRRMDKVTKARDVLPAALRELPDPEGVLARAQKEVVLEKGYFIVASTMPDAPFTVVYVAQVGAIWYAIGASAIPAMGVLLVGCLGVVWIARHRMRRDFVDPAEKLVAYIAAEGEGAGGGLPTVPSGWRDWFATIQRAFSDHARMVAIDQEIDMARRLQESILPHRFPATDSFALAALAWPAREVGGDFYDFFAIDVHRTGLVIADVSGKGMPAALFMAMARMVLRAVAPTATGPGACLQRVNDLLAMDNDAGMFVTVFYAVYDARDGQLTFANGGHNHPLVLRAGGAVDILPGTDGTALGLFEDLHYDERAVTLAADDLLILYTDGVTEAQDTAHELFGEARLLDVTRGLGSAAPELAAHAIAKATESFAGDAPQADDLTVLIMRVGKLG